jgi:hypothetical protein
MMSTRSFCASITAAIDLYAAGVSSMTSASFRHSTPAVAADTGAAFGTTPHEAQTARYMWATTDEFATKKEAEGAETPASVHSHHFLQQHEQSDGAENSSNKIPTLPNTGEEWGTQITVRK